MSDNTTPVPVADDRALVPAQPARAVAGVEGQVRAWLRNVALRTRHDDGLDPDTGQPRPRHPLRPLFILDEEPTPTPTIIGVPGHVHEDGEGMR